MSIVRASFNLTMLANGNVLAAGGNSQTNLAEQFNPNTATWSSAGFMNAKRSNHATTLLADGRVLVSGGFDGNVLTNSAEVFDPAFLGWASTPPMNVAHYGNPTILLPDGKVFVAGFSVSELYDIGLGFVTSAQPRITSVPSPYTPPQGLALGGTGFRGVSEAAGGNAYQSSASDHPVVALRSLESGQTLFLHSTSWTTNAYTSVPITNFPARHAMVTVFVNGIPSTGVLINVTSPAPVPIILTNPVVPSVGMFQFTFTNTPGATFDTLMTTDLSQPLSSWTNLGSVTETSAGHFQFTDTHATNQPQRYYSVRWP
jgi:hypothetical protein